MKDQRRCTATLSDGSRRCRNAAILGGSVRKVHGGAARQVRRAARERLESLVGPAISGLRTALEDGDVSHPIRAATAVLDRVGHGPSMGLVIEKVREQERSWLFDLLDRLDLDDEQRERLGTIVGLDQVG